jgi:hypothetical protein
VPKPARSLSDRDPVVVARELPGKYLLHRSGGVERIGRIVADSESGREHRVPPPGKISVLIYHEDLPSLRRSCKREE